MSALRVAAVDLGAGSGRVAAVQWDGRRLEAREAHRFATPRRQDPASGHLCWDLEAIEAEVRRGLDSAASEGPLRSLGIDGWGVDHVLLDAAGRRTGPAVSYQDGRTRGMLDVLGRRMSREELYLRTGIQPMEINTLFQLAQAAQAHPEWFEEARHLLMLPDYLHFRLCGTLANEFSEASTSQLLALDGRDWDRALLALAGLSRLEPPPPVPSGTVLGEWRPGVAVIAPAAHDTASAVAAIPFQDADEIFISSGSWALMGFESREPHASLEALRWGFSCEGGAGGVRLVLKNLIGLLPAQRLAAETGLDHAALAQAAEAAAPWGALIDPEDTRFLNPESMTGAIRAYCADTGQRRPEGPGELARCVFESLALAFRRARGQIEALRGRAPTRIRLVGGGSRNRLLNQLCADACALPVLAGPVETSALGNACVQLAALGAFSLAEAREALRRDHPPELWRPAAEVPDEAWRRFCALSG